MVVEERRSAVRVAVKTEMASRGWNIQQLHEASRAIEDDSPLDKGTIGDFLEGVRWPRLSSQAKLEKALGWWPGTISAMLEGHSAPPVGGGTQDADYVAAPGERTDQAVTNEQVLAEVRAMRDDISALERRIDRRVDNLSERVARIESDPEPVGGADGQT